MSTAYDEIIRILSGIEEDDGLPTGTLKKIYDIERNVVHLLHREQTHTDLHNVVANTADKVKKNTV